ncbi:DUF934 domain-containing protein [Marinospirillum perlucidum]|uniref:DUF934 domain-containing protein n=1 Tax=Marinospirillum perlucidum TaxID=1982602 RepID=UPI000DF27415|nr:DUF934 domain-containing protein [Marinospirillum perlucidum]
MPLLVNRQAVEKDPWQFIYPDAETGELPADAWPQAAVLPASHLAELEVAQLAEERALGAWLTTEEEVDLLLPWVEQLELVAIEFPVFRDGRGFSQARLLRRAGFKGELRARGDVARDRLAYMERCGFDAFDIPAERFDATDLGAFTEISVHYQPGVKRVGEEGHVS